jgi:type VI protein secretion system component VasF
MIMRHRHEHDEWISNVLKSIAGIKPAVPADTLYASIEENIETDIVRRRIPKGRVVAALVALFFLFFLNIAILISEKKKSETIGIAAYYFGITELNIK